MTSSILLMNESPSLKVKKVIPSLFERRGAFTHSLCLQSDREKKSLHSSFAFDKK
jgi:hypothetical protein